MSQVEYILPFHKRKKKTFNLITGLLNAEDFLDWKDSFTSLSSSDDVTKFCLFMISFSLEKENTISCIMVLSFNKHRVDYRIQHFMEFILP